MKNKMAMSDEEAHQIMMLWLQQLPTTAAMLASAAAQVEHGGDAGPGVWEFDMDAAATDAMALIDSCWQQLKLHITVGV